jgi:signal transduction histidine kinase
MVSGTVVVGRLAVTPRRDAKVLSPVDRQLLEDLARHSGVAAQVAGLLTELRTAQQRLLVAREAERHRIHCDLHDGVGPTLVGLTLQLEVAAELAGDGPLADLLRRLHAASARATQDVRGLVRALRPADLDELGLPAAIAAAAARLDAPSAPRFDLKGPTRLPELSADVEDAAYIICLEAMSNAVRHSHAKNCSVYIGQTASAGFGIEIRDDGRGFGSDASTGTGLASMRERAESVGGRLHVDSTPGGGTRIEVELPTTSTSQNVSMDAMRERHD